MRAEKPSKPRADFPLFPHGNGQWAKKIKGKLHYFGAWDDHEAALNKYLDERDELQAGRVPKSKDDTRKTIFEVCDHFMLFKKGKAETGELSQQMLHGYDKICRRLFAHFGKKQVVEDLTVADFAKLRTSFTVRQKESKFVADREGKAVSLVTVSNLIQHTRTVFKYAYDAGLIPVPIRFGVSFDKTAKLSLRKEEDSKPTKIFKAEELRAIIEAAKQPLKTMTLLGINCAFGQTDCSMLPMKALDLDGGWINFPRPKTGIKRRCPLWPETVEALQEALSARRTPQDERLTDRVFINANGLEYVRFKENGTNLNGISLQFGKLLKSLDLSGNGRSFYAARHTFETIGGGTRDQIAVDAIMGHAPHGNDMSANYRHGLEDARLRAVVDHVRAWLWPNATKKSTKKTVKKTTKPKT